DRCAAAHRLHLGGDVGEDAVLGRDLPAVDDLLGHLQQPGHAAHAVVGGVDPDDAVPRPVGQPLVDRGADALDGVGGVVGLVAGGEGALQADSVVAVGGDPDLA